jgi:hypothetical protein
MNTGEGSILGACHMYSYIYLLHGRIIRAQRLYFGDTSNFKRQLEGHFANVNLIIEAKWWKNDERLIGIEICHYGMFMI